jgi:hypothetical protein
MASNLNEDNTSSPENAKTYLVKYSLDAQEYFRHECSSCGLHFKTKASEQEIVTTLSPLIRRVEQDSGLTIDARNESIVKSSKQVLCCPYCGHSDEPQNMISSEFRAYAVRWLQREVVYPIISNFLQSLSDTLSGNRNSFIKISVETDSRSKPVRPIYGPELPDMIQVDLLCCGKSIKIAKRWSDSISCPFCEQTLMLI